MDTVFGANASAIIHSIIETAKENRYKYSYLYFLSPLLKILNHYYFITSNHIY